MGLANHESLINSPKNISSNPESLHNDSDITIQDHCHRSLDLGKREKIRVKFTTFRKVKIIFCGTASLVTVTVRQWTVNYKKLLKRATLRDGWILTRGYP